MPGFLALLILGAGALALYAKKRGKMVGKVATGGTAVPGSTLPELSNPPPSPNSPVPAQTPGGLTRLPPPGA